MMLPNANATDWQYIHDGDDEDEQDDYGDEENDDVEDDYVEVVEYFAEDLSWLLYEVDWKIVLLCQDEQKKCNFMYMFSTWFRFASLLLSTVRSSFD